MSKLLVVFAATGNQGRSVINAVLNDAELSKQYSIRGTTRDPSKPEAQELVKRGVEVVAADVNDPESLRNAFKGAEIVFSYTVTIYDGKTKEHEIQDGRALADAVVATKVPKYIWSTLPNTRKIAGSVLKGLDHFDGKAEVEDYIRTLPIRSAFFAPGCFMQNFQHGLLPRPLGEGLWAIAGPVSPETPLALIDILGDTGKWVAPVLADFDAYEGTVLSCSSGILTFREAADTIAKVTGKNVVYNQLPADLWKSFLPEDMREHMHGMFKYFEDYGYFGQNTAEKVEASAAKARGKLTSFEEWLVANPLEL